MSTKLDDFKKRHGLKHDGKAVLLAAELGEFAVQRREEVADNIVYMRSPLAETLKKFGVEHDMSRDQFVKKLQDIRNLENHPELIRIIEQEIQIIRSQMRNLPQSVPLHPNADNKDFIREIARKKIIKIINQVISFCEDEAK